MGSYNVHSVAFGRLIFACGHLHVAYACLCCDRVKLAAWPPDLGLNGRMGVEPCRPGVSIFRVGVSSEEQESSRVALNKARQAELQLMNEFDR
jgi:hypothetical protein